MQKIDFNMVHPQTFIQNPLVNHIADEPYWTLSDDKKIPINARAFLESGEIFNARFDGESPLVTLHQLDERKELEAVNRTYRLRARENRIIMIDVEPEASDTMKKEALNMPAHYTELSMNGGVHLLIRVPDDLVTDDNRYMFDDLSVFKEPVPKDDERDAHYEVLFNDHFITFTKRMDTQKPCIDYNQDPQAKAQLKSFLDNIVALDKQRQKEREIAKQHRIELLEDTVNDEKLEIIDEFINLKAFDRAREQAGEKSIEGFNNDYSRYEMSVASGLANHTLRIKKLAKDTQSYRELASQLTEQDIAYAVYLLVQEALPHRDKHDEEREGLPWLLFTSKRAYEYVKAKNS